MIFLLFTSPIASHAVARAALSRGIAPLLTPERLDDDSRTLQKEGEAIIYLINITLLTFMAILAIAIARQNNLFAAIILTGIFSLVSASVLLILDAVDVAFTEAAVGAGISTVLMLGALGADQASEDRGDQTPSSGPLPLDRRHVHRGRTGLRHPRHAEVG